MWHNRSRNAFALSMLISGIVSTQMLLYACHLIWGWNLESNLFQWCNMWMRSMGIFSIAYLLDALVLMTLAALAFAVLRQTWMLHRAGQKLAGSVDIRATKRLMMKYGEATEGRLLVIHASAPLAFAMGFVKRRVVLSTGMLAMLDEEEERAVILHELHHLRHHDPLKTFLMRLHASVFCYIPLLRWLADSYHLAREILADAYASGQQGSEAHVGSALLKLIRAGQTRPQPYAHVSFAEHAVNYRIRMILDPRQDVKLRVPWPTVLYSTISVVALMSLLLWAIV
ncbi:hypothetical protein PA598K_02397 [Paenibacillus sp. 598K]|uniref:M56 family metallopeptidase n=1 Tax=Paenibacillus sp. 598K TaxID=1117987 RepID=UPI000FF9DF96|nr:M56 family metallopeptidase [Paenibacillus sp. 598K]GBF74066.1 hypothetical protein PA598K_02397 [Paenibacillus sp. 598K]